MTRHIFAEIAPRLYDNGWTSLLPLAGKRPIVEGWSQYNCDPVPEDVLEDWCRRWPGAGIGLPLGRGVCAIDVDVLDPVLAERVEGIANDVLGYSPAKRIGRAPKFVRLYSGDIGTAKAHPLEVFGSSGQVAIYGTHPDTGRAYFWPADEPLWLSPEDLPRVEQAAVDAFVGEALRIIPPKPVAADATGTGDNTERNVDLFTMLREQRRGRRGQEWVDVLATQLRSATEGTFHNVMVSVVGSLVWRDLPDVTIKAFVADHLQAPRVGIYAAVWRQVDTAIASARKKRRAAAVRPWARHG